MKINPTARELWTAIRAKCMDCSGGSRREVQNCRVNDCPLRPYRVGDRDSKDKPEKGQISLFDIIEGR